MVTVGFGTTLAVPVCVWLLQPAFVPITLYIVVAAGLAITELPFGVFNDADGDQVYVDAPLDVKVTLVPAHILPDVTAMVGFGTTVMVYTAWLVHEPAVPNTVMVATVCNAVTGPVMVIGFVLKFGEPLKPAGNVHT